MTDPSESIPDLQTAEQSRQVLDELQTAVLQLALKAAPGSDIRRALCDAATMYPEYGEARDAMQVDPRGGLSRDDVADLLRRINVAREQGGDPQRSLRQMRNQFERAIDLFDLPPQ